MTIEIYDTTLRDGQQNADSNMFTVKKIEMFQKLDSIGVPYIELSWPASPTESIELYESCRRVRKQAQIVAFGSTSINSDPSKDYNLESLLKSRADFACIFGKTWKSHVIGQLRITPQENILKIGESLKFLNEKGMKTFYDAEHYFDGYKDDRIYALETLITASRSGVKRLILCDTNGGTLPHEAEKIVRETREELDERGIDTPLGTHFHDDCGLAVANSLVTAPYVKMIQGTANGIGERVGNLNWITFVVDWVHKMNGQLAHNLDWNRLKEVGDAAFTLSGLPANKTAPFIGDYAYAHKGGVHINATIKSSGASYEHMDPTAFGNRRRLLLTSQGGRDSIRAVAEQFNYKFDRNDPEFIRKSDLLFKKLRAMEDDGYRISSIRAEHFLLIGEYFGGLDNFFKLSDWHVNTGLTNGREKSVAWVKLTVNGENRRHTEMVHGGPIHAIYNSFIGALVKEHPQLESLKISDFYVDLANHLGVRSPVRNYIRFSDGISFGTVGVSDNIIRSSVQAIEKGIRYYLNTIKNVTRKL